jgi:hypothetical protein
MASSYYLLKEISIISVSDFDFEDVGMNRGFAYQTVVTLGAEEGKVVGEGRSTRVENQKSERQKACQRQKPASA